MEASNISQPAMKTQHVDKTTVELPEASVLRTQVFYIQKNTDRRIHIVITPQIYSY